MALKLFTLSSTPAKLVEKKSVRYVTIRIKETHAQLPGNGLLCWDQRL